jgi:hypothetical protein
VRLVSRATKSRSKFYALVLHERFHTAWVDSGLDLAHDISGAPSGLAKADSVNSIDFDPDRADVPTVPTDIALDCISLGRLV